MICTHHKTQDEEIKQNIHVNTKSKSLPPPFLELSIAEH